jgi:ribokinase
MSVLVFGSLNLDLVAYADLLPTLGQTVTGEKLMRFPGGKGLNQAIAAKRAGAQVLMVGAIGSDSEGDFLSQVLKSEGINSDFINQVTTQTGVAVIEVAKDAQNRILIIPGANALVRFKAEYLINAGTPKVCLAQLETPIAEVEKFIVSAKAAGAITILNPAPIQSLSSAIAASCDYLVVNETESSYLVGTPSERLSKEEAIAIGKQLLGKGFNQIIITLAENGSIFIDHNRQIYTPAFKVSALDTTAAGDAFCGAFATALSEDNSIEYALKFASAAGALAATKAGAVPSLPNSQEILSLIASVQ